MRHLPSVLRPPFALLQLALLVVCGGCTSKIDWGDLVTSGRDGWQRPEAVVAALDIRAGDRVAEIGAGDGYWLPWLSKAVGPEGVVFAVEVEAEKIDELRERVARDGLSNVVVILGRYEDPLLPDGGVDLAMTCLTYHHIEDRVPYFERLRADLAPGGRVVHLDDRDDLSAPLAWVTSGHNSNVDEMDAEMEAAGYDHTRHLDFLVAQAFREYVPREPPGPVAMDADR